MASFVDVRVREEGQGYVIEASGELDLTVVQPMTRAVRAVCVARPGPDEPLVIDLSGVEFMDSEGVRALLVARQLAALEGADVVLRDPSGPATLTLGLAGVLDAFA